MNEEKKIDYAAMSDEEYIECAARLLACWANLSTMPIVYGEGSSKTRKSITKSWAAFCDQTKQIFARANLNRKRALAIGFKPFSEEAPKLLLAPLWYCSMIPEGEEVVTVGGARVKYSRTLNHDIRFGCVAFGFEFEAPEEKGAAGQAEPGHQDKEG